MAGQQEMIVVNKKGDRVGVSSMDGPVATMRFRYPDHFDPESLEANGEVYKGQAAIARALLKYCLDEVPSVEGKD